MATLFIICKTKSFMHNDSKNHSTSFNNYMASCSFNTSLACSLASCDTLGSGSYKKNIYISKKKDHEEINKELNSSKLLCTLQGYDVLLALRMHEPLRVSSHAVVPRP